MRDGVFAPQTRRLSRAKTLRFDMRLVGEFVRESGCGVFSVRLLYLSAKYDIL